MLPSLGKSSWRILSLRDLLPLAILPIRRPIIRCVSQLNMETLVCPGSEWAVVEIIPSPWSSLSIGIGSSIGLLPTFPSRGTSVRNMAEHYLPREFGLVLGMISLTRHGIISLDRPGESTQRKIGPG